jgi:hypothetical protein
MIIKRDMALASLTKVCEESLALIKQLIDIDNATYAQGYEDGMAAQAKVQQTLKPWVELTRGEIEAFPDNLSKVEFAWFVERQLRERNEKT